MGVPHSSDLFQITTHRLRHLFPCEAQRIRLAAQLGSNLQGVCYVLDEPTIGLHARDNQILLNALHKLGDKGNTLVVVEHDDDTIRLADHLIDIGPGAGSRGGQLVAQGNQQALMATPESQTAPICAIPFDTRAFRNDPLLLTGSRLSTLRDTT